MSIDVLAMTIDVISMSGRVFGASLTEMTIEVRAEASRAAKALGQSLLSRKTRGLRPFEEGLEAGDFGAVARSPAPDPDDAQ